MNESQGQMILRAKCNLRLLQSLEKEFKQYFTELSQEHETLARNPFFTAFNVSSISAKFQKAFLNLKDSPAHDLFK